MRVFVMSQDAHTVMAVPRHRPGPAGEGCGRLDRCLPLLIPGISGQPLPARSGHPKLQGGSPWNGVPAGYWEGWDRSWGPGSTCYPKVGAGDREEPSRERWEMGLAGQSSCPIPVSRGNEDAIWKRTPEEAALALGCLAELIPAALIALLLLSLLSSLPTLLDCCLTPFLHGAPLCHEAGTASPLSLAKGIWTCPQPAGGDGPGQDMLVAGQGAAPTSSTCAAEGLAAGNGAPEQDGNAEERGLPVTSDRPGWPGRPGRSRSSWACPCRQWGCLRGLCSAGTPCSAGGWRRAETSICVRVSVLGVVCVGPAAPGYAWAVSACVAGCPLYPQRVWPVPKRRTWASTRSWTRPCWS